MIFLRKIFLTKQFLLVMRYSLDEFRRILVDEKTFIESKEPIIPRKN